jgi:hypothetical protein
MDRIGDNDSRNRETSVPATPRGLSWKEFAVREIARNLNAFARVLTNRAVRAEAKEGVAFLFGKGATRSSTADPIFRLIRDHEARLRHL